MTRQDKLNLVNRWFQEVWNDRVDETIDELCAHDAWFESSMQVSVAMNGPEQFLEFRNSVLDVLPDLHIDVIHQAVDDDVVVSWLSCIGTLSPPAFGLVKDFRVVFSSVVWFEVSNGQIQGGRSVSDLSGIQNQIADANVGQLT